MKETTKEAKEETKAVIKEEQPKPATFPEAEKATKKQVYYYCFLTYRDKEERQKQVAIMLKDESLSKKELSNMIDKAKKEYYRQKEERKFEWRKEHGYKGKEEAERASFSPEAIKDDKATAAAVNSQNKAVSVAVMSSSEKAAPRACKTVEDIKPENGLDIVPLCAPWFLNSRNNDFKLANYSFVIRSNKTLLYVEMSQSEACNEYFIKAGSMKRQKNNWHISVNTFAYTWDSKEGRYTNCSGTAKYNPTLDDLGATYSINELGRQQGTAELEKEVIGKIWAVMMEEDGYNKQEIETLRSEKVNNFQKQLAELATAAGELGVGEGGNAIEKLEQLLKEAPASKKQEEKHEDKQQPRKPQVGDIYYFSFGYDATFYRFYQIIALKGSFATVREVEPRSERVDSTGYGPNAWKTKKHITPGEILPAVQRTGDKPQDRKRKISYCTFNHQYYFVADDGLKERCYSDCLLKDGQIFLEDNYN